MTITPYEFCAESDVALLYLVSFYCFVTKACAERPDAAMPSCTFSGSALHSFLTTLALTALHLQATFGSCYCSLGIIGPADCPVVNADCPTAWNTMLTNQGEQYIDVAFEEAVFVTQVRYHLVPKFLGLFTLWLSVLCMR